MERRRLRRSRLRHSSIDLAMLAHRGENVYTDPSLLDMAGALGVLPQLVLDEDVRVKAPGCAGTN